MPENWSSYSCEAQNDLLLKKILNICQDTVATFTGVDRSVTLWCGIFSRSRVFCDFFLNFKIRFNNYDTNELHKASKSS